MNVDGVWVHGWKENEDLLVREQRLDLASLTKRREPPPSLDQGFGLIVGFNPPYFYSPEWPRRVGDWTLCMPKATHLKFPFLWKKTRDLVSLTGCQPAFVNVVAIVNLHLHSGDLESSIPKLAALQPEQVLARFEENLPSERPRWVWCAWSNQLSCELRDGAVDVLSRTYPGVFNFGLYGIDSARHELHINEAEKAVLSFKVW